MKAVIYARVSSGMQADLGTSIPSQIKICREYAEKNGYTVIKVYEDEGKSARTDDRPAFQEMINEAKKVPKAFDAILIYNQSRFSRNTLDTLTYKNLLKQNGVDVISVTEPFDEESPQGRLINGIITVINEFYSANLGRETIRGQRENANQGFWNGGTPPIGYKVKKIKRGNAEKSALEIDENWASVVKEIFRLFVNGNGIKKIAILLNERGLKTPRGNLWKPSTVRGILINSAYTGTLVWNKYEKKVKNKKYKDPEKWIVIENAHPQIIDKQIFDSAQALIKRNGTFNPKSMGRTHTLSGILKCGKCGSNYVFTQVTKTRGRKTYTSGYYRCALRNNLGRKQCDNISLKADFVERLVLETVSTKIFTKENLSKIADNLNKNRKELSKELQKEKNLIKESVKKNEKKIENLLKGIEKGVYEDALIQRINELKENNEVLLFRLSQIENNIPPQYREKDIEEVVKIIRQGLEDADPEKLNHFFKIFLDETIVNGDKLEFHYTFPKLKGDSPDLSAFCMVPRDGIEPPTRGFSVHCSTD